MSNDEDVRLVAAGRPDGEHQPPQLSVLANHVHGTEVIPEQKVAFRVDINGLIWSYELQATEQGTRVIESRHAENGAKPVANFAVNAFFGGVPNFERELVEGMNASLARIKAAAESG